MGKITISRFLTVLQFPNSFLEGIPGFDHRSRISWITKREGESAQLQTLARRHARISQVGGVRIATRVSWFNFVFGCIDHETKFIRNREIIGRDTEASYAV